MNRFLYHFPVPKTNESFLSEYNNQFFLYSIFFQFFFTWVENYQELLLLLFSANIVLLDLMSGHPTPGSIRVGALRRAFLQAQTLSLRGRNGLHWIAITWWEDVTLHLIHFSLNGTITNIEYTVLNIYDLVHFHPRRRRPRRG